MQNEVFKRPFLTNADIIEVLHCSPSKASRIKRIIIKELQARGKKVVTNDIPTHLFVEIMNLNVEL